MHARRRTAWIIVLIGIACAQTPTPLYEGPPRKSDEVAALSARHVGKVRILYIDGREVDGVAFHLEPRHQTLVVQLHDQIREGNRIYTVKGMCRFAIDFEAGKTYEVHYVRERIKGAVTQNKTTLGAEILRVDDGVQLPAMFCN